MTLTEAERLLKPSVLYVAVNGVEKVFNFMKIANKTIHPGFLFFSEF